MRPLASPLFCFAIIQSMQAESGLIAKRLTVVWVSFCVIGFVFTREASEAALKFQQISYLILCGLTVVALVIAFVLDYRQDRERISLHENRGFRPALVTVICCYIMLPVFVAGMAFGIWTWRDRSLASMLPVFIRFVLASVLLRTLYSLIVLRARLQRTRG